MTEHVTPQWYRRSREYRYHHQQLELLFNNHAPEQHAYHESIYALAFMIGNDYRHVALLEGYEWWHDFLMTLESIQFKKSMWIAFINNYHNLRFQDGLFHELFQYHKEGWIKGLRKLQTIAQKTGYIQLFTALHFSEPHRLSHLFFEESLDAPIPDGLELPSIDTSRCSMEHIIFWGEWLKKYDVFRHQQWLTSLSQYHLYFINAPMMMNYQPLTYGH